MQNACALLRKKIAERKRLPYRGCRCSPKERAVHLRKKILSLVVAGALGFGAVGFACACALPPTSSSLQGTGKAPISLQLWLPYCSAKKVLPYGTEAVSELMLLHYWGIPAGLDNVVSSLSQTPLQTLSGTLTGPDPEKSFAGSPRKKGSGGCFARPVKQSLAQFLPPLLKAQDTSGTSLETLIQKYVSAGQPVLLWATEKMDMPAAALSWQMPAGGTCFWPKNTDCMVLVGYDPNGCWLEDPMGDSGPTYWKKPLVNSRYEALGRHSLVVYRTA
ncbi:MAG: C39 family peptidase [Oscillospiraceae bacterium]|jgi:uncharacterized protein YvpB|nr:C39 family peptidase [Oscillospiraceae bacterium]MDD3261624.1 C39 family peptidase [Oscillospiraceae bacterium]